MPQLVPPPKSLRALRCNACVFVAVLIASTGILEAQVPQRQPWQFLSDPTLFVNPRIEMENLQSKCDEETKTDAEEQTTLSTYTSAPLQKAFSSGPEFWSFLIDPSTSYLDRMAAAHQGGLLIGPTQLEQLWKAVTELESAPSGVYPTPCDYIQSAVSPPSSSQVQERWSSFLKTNGGSYSVLGPIVDLPANVSDYPTTAEERDKAPWLWQMGRAMSVLSNKVIEYYGDPQRYPLLVQAAMQWNPVSSKEASVWRESSLRAQAVMSYFAPRNPLFLQTAVKLALGTGNDWSSSVATSIPQHLYPYDCDYHFEELLHVAQIVILQKTRDGRVAAETAYWVEQLAHEKYNSYSPQIKALSTATGILAMSRWATDQSLSPWDRYYGFVLPICSASANCPFQFPQQIDPESPEVAKSLNMFDEWFAKQRGSLEKQAAEELPHQQSLASELSLTIK
jgi:hypothetical protein